MDIFYDNYLLDDIRCTTMKIYNSTSMIQFNSVMGHDWCPHFSHHPTISYMVNAMATFSGDVQYSQNGTVTNPWVWTPSCEYHRHWVEAAHRPRAWPTKRRGEIQKPVGCWENHGKTMGKGWLAENISIIWPLQNFARGKSTTGNFTDAKYGTRSRMEKQAGALVTHTHK